MSETPTPYTGKPAPKTQAAPKAQAAPTTKTAAKAKAPATSKAKTPSPSPAASPAPPAAPVPAPAQQATAPVVSYVTIWHNRAVLIAVGALAALAGIGTAIGAFGFPVNAPVESIQAFGVVVDMIAVVVALIILTITEFRRRADPIRIGCRSTPGRRCLRSSRSRWQDSLCSPGSSAAGRRS